MSNCVGQSAFVRITDSKVSANRNEVSSSIRVASMFHSTCWWFRIATNSIIIATETTLTKGYKSLKLTEFHFSHYSPNADVDLFAGHYIETNHANILERSKSTRQSISNKCIEYSDQYGIEAEELYNARACYPSHVRTKYRVSGEPNVSSRCKYNLAIFSNSCTATTAAVTCYIECYPHLWMLSLPFKALLTQRQRKGCL